MRRVEFTAASRKHRVGRAHVRFVLATTTPREIETNQGGMGWLYIGPDDRGVMLEVIVVAIDEDTFLVIHAMPHILRGGH